MRTECGYTFGVGAVFAFPHVYLVPYGSCTQAVRFDVRRSFADRASWETHDVTIVPGNAHCGFDGAFFDGRFVYFIPFFDEREGAATPFHSALLKYDTHCASFTDDGAWTVEDIGSTSGLKTIGYNAGASDGRFLYFAPWHCGEGANGLIQTHGRVLRVDTVGTAGAAFSLRWSDLGHNGGLTAALPGPRFLVNTVECGVVTASADAPAPAPAADAADADAGEQLQHVVGVFDGARQRVMLAIDGHVVAERATRAPCRLAPCTAPVTVGALHYEQDSAAASGEGGGGGGGDLLPGSFLGTVVAWRAENAVPTTASPHEAIAKLAADALSTGTLRSLVVDAEDAGK